MGCSIITPSSVLHHLLMKIMILSFKDSRLVEYFAFLCLRKAAINIIFVYLESLNQALQFPFWVNFSHGWSPPGWQAMKYKAGKQ